MLANFARFPSSSPTPPPQRPNIPRRTDSLNKIIPRSASPSAAHQKLASTNALPPIFAAVEDELRDARRVGTHWQEEDLRAALGNVIGRVEELVRLFLRPLLNLIFEFNRARFLKRPIERRQNLRHL